MDVPWCRGVKDRGECGCPVGKLLAVSRLPTGLYVIFEAVCYL